MFLCSKWYFIACFTSEEDCEQVIENGSWFWGSFGLSIQRWYPDFNPLDVSAMITLIWVRFLNLPLHLSSHDSLETIGNCLGRFVKSGTERVSKGLATFAHICVELDLSKGLPDKIFIDWGGQKPHLQLLDFEYIAFQTTRSPSGGMPYCPSSHGKKETPWLA